MERETRECAEAVATAGAPVYEILPKEEEKEKEKMKQDRRNKEGEEQRNSAELYK